VVTREVKCLETECYDAYDQYQFQRAVNALSAFATNELSALYLDVAKDRLYVSPQHSARRRSCQSVLIACLNTLPRLLAPLLPHLAEELWQALPYKAGDAFSSERGSVFDLAEPWTPGRWPHSNLTTRPSGTRGGSCETTLIEL